MTDWNAEWRSKIASVPSRAKRVRELKSQYGALVEKYKGGLPLGFALASMQWESDGRMSAPGDPTLGEVGVYQVSGNMPATIGVAPSVRLTLEGNVFLGLFDYNLEAVQFALEYPGLVQLGTPDSWKLSRLGFAIGHNGTRSLIAAAGEHVRRGNVYGGIKDWVESRGGQAITVSASQDAGKVGYRVRGIDLVWQIGEESGVGMSYGWPQLTPAPAGVHYRVSPLAVPYFREPSSPLFMLGLAGFIIWGAMRLLR